MTSFSRPEWAERPQSAHAVKNTSSTRLDDADKRSWIRMPWPPPSRARPQRCVSCCRRAADEQDTNPAVARQHALQARVDGPRRRRQGRRGRGALPSGEHRPLRRRPGGGVRAGDGSRARSPSSAAPSSCSRWSVHLLGIVHYQASNFSEALDHCLRALDVYHSTGDDVDAGNILNTIAAIYHSMGDNDRAVVTYEQALAASEPFGRMQMVALILGNIARIRSSRSEYLPAVSMGRRAVEIARDHNPSIVTNLLADLAEAYMGLADRQKAAECFAEARRVLADASADRHRAELLGATRRDGRRGPGRLCAAVRSTTRSPCCRRRSTCRSAPSRASTSSRSTTCWPRRSSAAAASRRRSSRRERHDAQYRKMFTHAADLRLRTLQVAHDTATARQQAEIFRLRTQELEVMVASDDRVHAGSATAASHQLEAFEQLAILTEFRDAETGEHTNRVGDLAAEIAPRPRPLARVVRAAPPGGPTPRRRQGRRARLGAPQDRPADGRGVRDDEGPHEHGPSDPGRQLGADVPDGCRDRPVPSRVVGRQWLPARHRAHVDRQSPAGSSRVADVYDALCSKRPVQAGVVARSRRRGSSHRAEAASSIPTSSTPSSP